ncbi:3-deoxy-D-manno-octulosonic-acid transferase [Hyunsoonleella jejuensis]|uniref:3-deoxy-D-manno-octulosonic acid transferase n=1 Tax=Hyunsoonleella jejuensis TaxID=419940 RepID=A0A1H8ZYA6_9FLAO|nr:glycosyltransferase N-terminal domain-containing protein [Hyunsoonleella jejuensis]SEP69486.1 3-deoxy-D-manno-octulosonic-acid transferase [Hyunsoonleella jejuensis]
MYVIHRFITKKCILAIKISTLQFIYNTGIQFISFILKITAFFNTKIKLGVEGRRKTFKVLEEHINIPHRTFWFHCASLGEYEQGLPVFEKLRARYKTHKIVLSFFSPSGYEIRKNSPIADVVVYLPLDTKKNASRFLNIIKPELAIFVKYDIWPNYLDALNNNSVRTILISAAFRNDQIYFKPYGSMFRKALFTFEHIFTQNEYSKTLLKSIGYNNTTVSGDTRFDRVSNQLKIDNSLQFIEEFLNQKMCIVVGSSWPEDEALFVNFINSKKNNDVKYIVAPHNIKTSQINNFKSKLDTEVILYSEKDTKALKEYSVLIIDTIGLLSKIYSYAHIAYVGGAMGTTGLHNTLEPAVFGIPILIGKNHQKFPEAQSLIDNGGMFAVENQNEFDTILTKLIENDNFRTISGSKNAAYINKYKGAVIQIINYLRI